MLGHDVLICLDMSLESLQNYSFFHAVYDIQALLSVLDEDTNLGFLLYDSVITYFKVSLDENDVCLARTADPDAPASLSHAELFLNAQRDRALLDQLLQFIQTFA